MEGNPVAMRLAAGQPALDPPVELELGLGVDRAQPQNQRQRDGDGGARTTSDALQGGHLRSILFA
jgi:hypothetical protein